MRLFVPQLVGQLKKVPIAKRKKCRQLNQTSSRLLVYVSRRIASYTKCDFAAYPPFFYSFLLYVPFAQPVESG